MQEKSKKILCFTSAFRPFIGGSEIALEEIASRLPQFEFDILTPRYSRKLPRLEKFGNISVFRIGFGWLPDKLFFPLAGFLKAAFLCLKKRYSVAHVFQASYGGGAGWIFKIFFPSVKFIVTLQEGKNLERQSLFVRFFRAIILKKADLITAISEYLKNYARKYNRRARIEVIPNGVDIERIKSQILNFETIELKNDLNINSDERIIITVSRLVLKNGVGDLIDAMSLVKNKIPNTRLLIIGDGPLKESLKFKVKNLKLDNEVLMVGEIPHDETSRYLEISDVFVRPSLSEGLGSAFLEAMAAGLPVIATPVGGIPDFIKDGETGLFCKVSDPNDLADKIIQILIDNSLREKLIMNGQKLVEQNYNWDKIAEKFADIYEA